jgi:hypothetical protein
MKLINLPYPLNEQVDTPSIKGISNHSPENTFRYNLDKKEYIESILGDVSRYIVDRSEIVENDPNLDI